MKTILLAFILFGFTVQANNIFDRDLDHLDRIEIGREMSAEGIYTVQYPGLGSQGFENPDCLILHFGRVFPSQDQLDLVKEKIVLVDGAGVLFNQQGRDRNHLIAKEISLSGSRGRKTLVYHLKDLGTYVTGLEVRAWSPYLSASQVLEGLFGESSKEIELVFLRGCEL